MESQRGFIALISAVIISAILMLVVVATSLSSIYSRYNTLDSELKARSDATADACADEALLQLAENGALSTTQYSLNSLDQCRIKETIPGSTFEVQATSSKTAVTNLKVIYNPSNFSVVSWQEIPNF